MLNQGAVSVLITVLILSMLLIAGMGLSALILQQLKFSGQVGRSVTAFYAAEAGAEKCLYQVWNDDVVGICDTPGALLSEQIDSDLNISFIAEYNGSDRIISRGYFGETSRSLELSW